MQGVKVEPGSQSLNCDECFQQRVWLKNIPVKPLFCQG